MHRRATLKMLFSGAAWLSLLLFVAPVFTANSTTQSLVTPMDAVVLINSTAGRSNDFSHYIQPYLETFGVPYTVLDIATNAVGTNISQYSLIIVAQRELDTNHARLSAASQSNLVTAVSNGCGMVNFDTTLTQAGTNLYSYVQSIYGFAYGSTASVSTLSFPATEAGATMHYVTALHPVNDSLTLKVSSTIPTLVLSSNSTSIVLANGNPFLVARKFGAGRALQWASADWMAVATLGPVAGLDDALWRGFVWSARKPFALRRVPHFVCFRIDDVAGPFTWAQTAVQVGLKPFMALFLGDVSAANVPVLRTLVTNGTATASPHSFYGSASFIYFNHQTETAYSDSVVSNNMYFARQFHITNGIPMCKTIATHYSEIGVNAFPWLLNWGTEYVPIEIIPGAVEYPASGPGAPWLVASPYRLFETPLQGQVHLPQYYADWLTVPTHPEMSNRFFNCYPEIRDTATCGEFCPDNNVAPTIARGVAILKRSLDSAILPSLFTHETYIQSATAANWLAELQGITNQLAPYKPVYVHLDDGNQYVRALKTSRFVTASYNAGSGQIGSIMSGKSDLALQVQVYTGADQGITNITGTFPVFTNAALSNVVLTLPVAASIVNAPLSRTNNANSQADFHVDATGTPPLSYAWYRGTTRLADGGIIAGTTTDTLTLSGVTGADAGSFRVVVTNTTGSVTSSPAALLTVLDPVITAQPVGRTNHQGAAVSLSISALGTSPNYSWLKGASRVSGAASATYTIPSLKPADAGVYSAVVSNQFGSATSGPASIAVFAPLAIESLSLTNDIATVSWSAVPGNSYALQYGDSLQQSNWNSENATVAVDLLAYGTNSLNNATQRFYRVLLNQ